MTAHLLNKVYISFDVLFQPVFDTIIVSKNHYSPHDSFINKHVRMGDHHGLFKSSDLVDWATFFNSVNDRRTMVYADPLNFAAIYFSLLKTINPDINKANAIKILEIILKRTTFYFVEYDIFYGDFSDEQKRILTEQIEETRQSYDQAWAQSKKFDLDQGAVQDGLGIEFLVARYWADGRNEDMVKDRLEQMWWKTFISWGEEYMKWYTIKWFHENPESTHQLMFAHVLSDPALSWMADPSLNITTVDEFRNSNDWSVIEKIHNAILSNQDNGLVIEVQEQWKNVVKKDWSVILDQSNPLNLLAVGTEPSYRVLLNSWLISYFATQSKQKLGEMVI